MSFSKMLEILQEKDKEKVILVRLGAFYIATGRDALLLHTKLNLKLTCFKDNICKVGIPVNSINKYIEKLDRTKYSYIIYDYDKEEVKLKVIHSKKGRINKIEDKKLLSVLTNNIFYTRRKRTTYSETADTLYRNKNRYLLLEGKIDFHMMIEVVQIINKTG